MRAGNFNLQRDSLSAAGPLFASAAKSNYTTAIAHFLATIASHPQLAERLNYCSAFKIPHNADDVCFGFDEALLMSEYLDDNSISHNKRAIESRQESLWALVDDLVIIFGMDDPLSHQLFQKYPPTEVNQEGLDRLIACYPSGLERIKGIYRQEVLKIEIRNTDTTKPQIKQKRHRTTEEETKILS